MTDSTAHPDAPRARAAADSAIEKALATARRDAAEYGIDAPDAAGGELLTLLTSLAAHSPGDSGRGPAAIAITPAAGLVGLHMFRGLPANGQVTCIDPDTEHQKLTRKAFREAGISPGRYRFMPTRPLQVMGRLARASYDVIYADVEPGIVTQVREAAWPLLTPGGLLVFADATGDASAFGELDDALVTRVLLGDGALALRKL